MNRLILLCAAVTLVAGTNYELGKEWNRWKEIHGKSYDTYGEEEKRLSVWLANKQLVDRHNAEAETHGFTLAMNYFGDLVGSFLFYKRFVFMSPLPALGTDR